MGAAEQDLKRQVTDYVAKNGADLGFTKYFWKDCEPLPRDLEMYSEYVDILTTATFRFPSAPAGVDRRQDYGFERVNSTRPPKLGLYLKALMEFGEPAPAFVWLNMECSHGYANPIGQYVQVPRAVDSWNEVEIVLRQLRPLGEPSSKFNRAYLFGFFVGMMIGDAHKPKDGRAHRNVHVVLSHRYDTNVRIGDFTSLCANQLGLRMQRLKDIPKPENKPFGFYQWVSQSSPFIDWIFNVVLGLQDGQHTTYDAVHLDWAIDASQDFRLGLLHGISESDGSVSIASQTVEFWVIPDWDFMIRLLASFGLKGFRNREAVSLVKSQAINSFAVPVFSSYLETVRYKKHELMATTKKLEKHDRLPNDVRGEIVRLAGEGTSIPKIVERIAREKGLLVSFEAAQRWALKSGNYTPRSSTQTKQ